MTNYAMVEEIVLEVLKKLENPVKLKKTEKSRLLVINTSEDTSLNHLEEKWDVMNVSSKSIDIPAEAVDAKKAVISNASQDLLVKGALGITDTFESILLSKLLMQGVSVELIPSDELEWLANKKNNYKYSEYMKQLVNYKKKLDNFGAKILLFSESILSSSSSNVNNSQNEIFYEKLLTKDHVKELTNENIIIGKSTIVTPLAKDQARELGKSISIINS